MPRSVIILDLLGQCHVKRDLVYSFLKALSIAALYCRLSEFCFRHFASGLPPPIAHLELVLCS